MKNLFIYHLVANVSLILYLYPWMEGWISTEWFMLLAFFHAFVFHPIVDYFRLLALGKIGRDDFPKMWKWGTLYRFKYYGSLTFGV
jgi:hypothetical protein